MTLMFPCGLSVNWKRQFIFLQPFYMNLNYVCYKWGGPFWTLRRLSNCRRVSGVLNPRDRDIPVIDLIVGRIGWVLHLLPREVLVVKRDHLVVRSRKGDTNRRLCLNR